LESTVEPGETHLPAPTVWRICEISGALTHTDGNRKARILQLRAVVSSGSTMSLENSLNGVVQRVHFLSTRIFGETCGSLCDLLGFMSLSVGSYKLSFLPPELGL
jgi:hypothetical protein